MAEYRRQRAEENERKRKEMEEYRKNNPITVQSRGIPFHLSLAIAAALSMPTTPRKS
jgi:hypothetical protein